MLLCLCLCRRDAHVCRQTDGLPADALPAPQGALQPQIYALSSVADSIGYIDIMAPFPDTCSVVLPMSAQDYLQERDSAAFRTLLSEVHVTR